MRASRERLEARGAAIDGDEQSRALLGERADRFGVRAIALEQPVGDMDHRRQAAMAQKAREQCRRCRAIDVVVAEDRDRLAVLDRIGEALRRLRHGGQHIRIGQQRLHGRIEIGLDRVGLDAAPGQDARQQFRHVASLRNRERTRGAALVQPVAPGAAAGGFLHAEKQARRRLPIRQSSVSGSSGTQNSLRYWMKPERSAILS